MLAQALELGVATRLIDHPELADEVRAVALRLRGPEAPATDALRPQLRALWLKIELKSGTHGALHEGLLPEEPAEGSNGSAG